MGSTKKIKKAVFSKKKFSNWDFDLEISHLRKKFSFSPQKCKLELCRSNGSKVLIYLSFLLKEAVFLAAAATPNKHMFALYLYTYKNQKFSFSHFILFYNSKN